jgi:5-methylcytosine-specific restriction protein A
VTRERYCPAHARQETRRYDQERGSAASRGYSSRWRAYRQMFLRAHPLCEICESEGKLTPASDVDHRQAVSGPGDPLFWDPANHRALCHACHSRKTAMEDGRWSGSTR